MMRRWLSCVMMLFVTLGSRAEATTIDPLLWQQLAEQADFIGIVECTVAGGIVAKYRVIETWKGASKPGDTISIRIATTYYGPRFPMVLVGERHLVTAFRDRAPSHIMSTTLGGPVPLWWRDVPSDYSLPLFQGGVSLNELSPLQPESAELFHEIGSQRGQLAEVREDFTRLLAMSDEPRALEILRALAQKYLTRTNYGQTPSPELAAGLVDAVDHDRAAQLLVERWDGPPEHRMRVARVVSQAAAGTQRLVSKHALSPRDRSYMIKAGDTLSAVAKQFRGDATAYDIFLGNRNVLRDMNLLPVGAVLQLRWRQGLINASGDGEETGDKPIPPRQKPNPISEVDLARAEDVFVREGEKAPKFWDSANVLIKQRPALVLRWLKEWRAPEQSWRDNPEHGYALGSWAAVNAGGDRIANLSALLDAKDELVRVAAGVYLAFEDEAKGSAALKKLMLLRGGPGSWAALALARRGDRAAAMRACEALDVSGGLRADALINDMLFVRVCELLSNTAAAHNLPQPFTKWTAAGEEAVRHAREFLERNPRMAPVDPWLPLLRAQKID